MVCIRSWTRGVWAFHTGENVSFVRSVRIHRYKPRTTEKMALTTIMYPETLSQPRVGMAMAGRVKTNAANIINPLTMPAAK